MERVKELFFELCAIPHGSGNMKQIARYCMHFAEKHGLWAKQDESDNVIIRKGGTAGYESAAPLILQGHLDMVCQKEEGFEIDFEKEGITPYVDGDLVRAHKTTLGADNGIAVAMILAILERNDLAHPPLEAVFTTDEEIGMLGAVALDPAVLVGKRMINLDAEADDTVTVSCAGGVDQILRANHSPVRKKGSVVLISFSDLQGGHSGVDIQKDRVNAAILAGKTLCSVLEKVEFSLVSLLSGDKANAIPHGAKVRLLAADPAHLCSVLKEELEKVKAEISEKEPNFAYSVEVLGEEEETVFSYENGKNVLSALKDAPYGVVKMSEEIPGLVETSLNLGILELEQGSVKFHFSLRSSKKSALFALEKEVEAFSRCLSASCERGGYYPPWEYREDSPLRDLYAETYEEVFQKKVKIEAIHAGLECAVFVDKIPDLDCISVGPCLFDIHSPREAMSLSSVERIYKLIQKILKKCH